MRARRGAGVWLVCLMIAAAPGEAADLRELLARVDATYDGRAPEPALQEALSAALREVRDSGNRALEAAVRARLGRLFLEDLVTGEAHLRRALEIGRELGDPGVEAAARFALGELKLRRRLPRKALDPLAQSVEIFHRLQDPQGEARALVLLSRANEQLGLYEEALTHLERAREVRPQRLPAVQEAAEGLRLGRLSYILGRYREAARFLETPLPQLRALRESAAPAATERYLEVMRSLVEDFKSGRLIEEQPGFANEMLGMADMMERGAEGYFAQAAHYGAPRPDPADLPDLRREEEEWLATAWAGRDATVRQKIKDLAARNVDFLVQGRLPDPMEEWFAEQADRLNRHLDSLRVPVATEERPTPERVEEATQTALKEVQLPFDQAMRLNFQLAARQAAQQARKMRQGSKPAADPADPDLTRLQEEVWAETRKEEVERYGAALAPTTLADWMEAVARRQARHSPEVEKRLGPVHAETIAALSCEAEIRNLLGRLHALDGGAKEAARQYQQAWEAVEATDLKVLQITLPPGEVSPTHLGYDLAAESAKARAHGMPAPPGLGRQCGTQGEDSLELWQGDALAADRWEPAALDKYRLAAAQGVDQVRALALGGIAAIYERQGRKQEALDAYAEAIEAVEEILGEIRLDQLVSSFAGRQAPLYTRAIDLAVDLKQPDRAFEFAERARARSFLNQVGNRRLDLQGAPPELIAEWQAARQRLEDVRARRRVRPSGPSADRDAVEDARAEDEASRAYEAALDRLKRASPEYASLVSVQVAGREEIQRLLPPATTLIEYFVFDRRTLAWVIDRETVHLVELPVAARDLQNRVEMLRQRLARRSDDAPGTRELYTALIAPLESYLRHDRLVLVPHGPLHSLPFAALRAPSGRFLIEDYTLSYTPSAGALRFLGRGKPAAEGALVLGDPDGSLPDAGREAEAIAALYGVPVHRGAAATEARVWDEAGRVGVLHLAAHGVYDPVHPLASRIDLAPGGGQDGRLEAHEIYHLDLSSTRLVVLSACDTALGKRSDGDDLVGLSRALLAAGAPAAVTTLWRIDDEAAAALMVALHRRLRQGEPTAEALRAAQREILAQPEWRSPFYWAAFALTGVDRGVTQDSPPR